MKVLVVSANAFSRTQNNGKTYEAIFSKFKKEDICQLYTRPQNISLIDFSYASSYYSVSELDIIKRLLLQQIQCGKEIINIEGYNCPSVYNNRKKRLFVHPLFRDIIWSIPLWKNRTLDSWLKRESPDHIFVVGGSEKFLYNICWYISNKLNIPYSLYYTDDYLIYPKAKSFLDKIQKIRMKRFYGKAVRMAKHAFVIGEKMKNEYENYFKRGFICIINSIKLYPYKTHAIPQKPYSISYFGGLHLDRWKMIVRLASLCKDEFVFFVYSTTKPNNDIYNAFNNNNIKFMGGLSPDEVHNKMIESDFLLHVECDNEFKNLTKLSVSTKIPEYLISGTPIIAFGPIDVASLQLLSDNSIGYVLDSQSDDDDVLNALNSIIKLESYEEMSRKAYDFAYNNYDVERISSMFYDTICN